MNSISTDMVQKYEQILRKDPNSQVFAPLADAYLEMGKAQQAEKLALRGLQLHPLLASGHVVMAKILRATNRPSEALESLDKAIQIAPENLLAYRLKGEILLENKSPKEALKAYKMVLFFNPQATKAQKIVQKLPSKMILKAYHF